MRIVVLDEDGAETRLARVEDLRGALERPHTKVWIDLVAPGAELLHELAALLDLHPLVVEDIGERNQRAKIELTGEALHLVMFQLGYAGELIESEIDIVASKRFLLTAHSAEIDLAAPGFLRRPAAAYLSEGTDFLLWAIADRLVDDYFPVFDKLSDEIEALGDDVMRRPSTWIVERLFDVRRDLLAL